MNTGRKSAAKTAKPRSEWSSTSSWASWAMATTKTTSKKSSSQLAWRSPSSSSVRRRGGRSSVQLSVSWPGVDTPGRLDLELDGDELDREADAVADHRGGDARADQLAGHEALKVVDALDRRVLDGDDHVLGPQSRERGRASLDHLHDLDAVRAPELAREPGRQRTRAARDADVGAREAPLAHERGEDLPRRVVDGHGEPEADPGHGRVDPDDAATAVGERPAGVARVEGGVGLDDVLDDPAGGARAHRQRTPERRDDASGHGSGETVRVTDRDDELADAETLGVPELGRDEVGRLRAQDGEVGERVGAYHLSGHLAAVHEGRLDLAGRARDNVRGGEHEAVGRDDDSAPAAGRHAAAAHTPRDAQVRDGRREPLRDGDDGARVGVERLLVRDRPRLGTGLLRPEERVDE